MELSEASINALESSTVNISRLNCEEFKDVYNRIVNVRSKFHVNNCNTRLFYKLFESRLSEIVPASLKQLPEYVSVHEHSIKYFWDFWDRDPKCNSVSFVRVIKDKIEDDDHFYNYFSCSDPVSHYTSWFTIKYGEKLALIHLDYRDLGFQIIEGDDMEVFVEFKIPRQLDALLLDQFVKKAPLLVENI